MNIFLTGATGFIGRALYPVLIKGDHVVTCAIRKNLKSCKISILCLIEPYISRPLTVKQILVKHWKILMWWSTWQAVHM